MGTRCCIEFYGVDEPAVFVYQHWDGYRDGVIANVLATVEGGRAWPLPRFEADEFGAAYIATNKTTAGNLRLLAGRHVLPHDLDYWHRVGLHNGRLSVTSFRTVVDPDTGAVLLGQPVGRRAIIN